MKREFIINTSLQRGDDAGTDCRSAHEVSALFSNHQTALLGAAQMQKPARSERALQRSSDGAAGRGVDAEARTK